MNKKGYLIRDSDFSNKVEIELQKLPPSDWVVEMQRHYNQKGNYRASDLYRLLGNPNDSVEFSNDSLKRRLLRKTTKRVIL